MIRSREDSNNKLKAWSDYSQALILYLSVSQECDLYTNIFNKI